VRDLTTFTLISFNINNYKQLTHRTKVTVLIKIREGPSFWRPFVQELRLSSAVVAEAPLR